MPRWPLDWLGLSPEASHTARVAGSHRTNGFGFSNTVELAQATSDAHPEVRSIIWMPLFLQPSTTTAGACAHTEVGRCAAWMLGKRRHARTGGVSHADRHRSARRRPNHARRTRT
ncbi:hypothetical protein BRN91_06870 [Xanthomonas oryzae pv. oryzae]|nr:hypothetical protein BRN91_06870 [Xanthomonas oryzae pv. oryzae]